MCQRHYVIAATNGAGYVRMRENGTLFLSTDTADHFCAHLAPQVRRRAEREFGVGMGRKRVFPDAKQPQTVHQGFMPGRDAAPSGEPASGAGDEGRPARNQRAH